MTWEAAEAFCPVCGVADVEVNESRDDYYTGELYRCSNRHHFRWQPEQPERHYDPGPDSPFTELIRDALPSTAEVYARPSILLELLEHTAKEFPGGLTVRIPLIRRDN